MRSPLPLVPFVLLGLVSACGGAETEGVDTSKNELTFTTDTFDVPPGDSFECFYTNVITDREMSVVGTSGQQGAGGHHIIVYYADTPRTPEHHPCVDSEMVNLHQIAGSNGKDNVGGEGLLALPDGLALKVPVGKQLVIQSHYINTTGATQKYSDTIALNLVDPSTVEAYVNYYAVIDTKFEVPAHQSLERSSICTLERDFDMVLSLGHMHENGTHYKLERIDDKGATLETLHDVEWRPEYASHPPISNFPKEKPMHLAKGTRLRQTCTWNNSSSDPLLFPREMCVAFFYYFPDAGDLSCDATPE